MKALRYAALLIPVTLAGCLLSTGQFNIDVDLDDAFVSGASVEREYVDLNGNTDYTDHKDDLVGLADIAVVGTAQNSTGSELEVEAWITPDQTNHVTAAAVRADAIKLWGPFSIGANETKKITWDDSAALFNGNGKYVLLQELKGDGTFTVYFMNAGASIVSAKTVGDPKVDGSEISLTGMTLIMTIEGED